MAASLSLPELGAPAIIKIAIFGDKSCGKTRLSGAFREGTDSRIDSRHNTRVTYINVTDRITKKKYTLAFWDMPASYRGTPDMQVAISKADAIFLMFDLTDRASYASVDLWFSDIRSRYRRALPRIYVIGTKLDVADDHGMRVVTWEELDAKCTENNWGCAQITAVEPYHFVRELLEEVTDELLGDREIAEQQQQQQHTPAEESVSPSSPPQTPRSLTGVLRRGLSSLLRINDADKIPRHGAV